MDPHLTYQDLRQDKKIENLFNIIRTVGSSTHSVQQACIINLLVTVFAARHPDKSLITENSNHQTISVSVGQPFKELIATSHAYGANTAP
jgi:hypothetical protein